MLAYYSFDQNLKKNWKLTGRSKHPKAEVKHEVGANTVNKAACIRTTPWLNWLPFNVNGVELGLKKMIKWNFFQFLKTIPPLTMQSTSNIFGK